MNRAEWVIDSETLSQRVTIVDQGKGYIAAKCADGTIYTAAELKILQSVQEDISEEVHIVKKLFLGTIVKIEAPEDRPSRSPRTGRDLFEMRTREEAQKENVKELELW